MWMRQEDATPSRGDIRSRERHAGQRKSIYTLSKDTVYVKNEKPYYELEEADFPCVVPSDYQKPEESTPRVLVRGAMAPKRKLKKDPKRKSQLKIHFLRVRGLQAIDMKLTWTILISGTRPLTGGLTIRSNKAKTLWKLEASRDGSMGRPVVLSWTRPIQAQ